MEVFRKPLGPRRLFFEQVLIKDLVERIPIPEFLVASRRAEPGPIPSIRGRPSPGEARSSGAAPMFLTVKNGLLFGGIRMFKDRPVPEWVWFEGVEFVQKAHLVPKQAHNQMANGRFPAIKLEA